MLQQIRETLGINPADWKKTIAGFDDEDLAPLTLKQGDTIRAQD